MTATTLTRPQPLERPDVAPRGGRRAQRRSPLLRPYLGYVGYFVGAGLVSGGIVHHPLDPGFYTVLAGSGVVLFLAATLLNEVVLGDAGREPRAVLRLVGASLLLSVGIGMLSGGIQHFTDFPARAATLIPAGMVLSFAAYSLRHGARGQSQRLSAIAVAVLVAAALSFLGLRAAAAALVDQGGGSHSHEVVVPGEVESPAAPEPPVGADHSSPSGHGEHLEQPASPVEPEPLVVEELDGHQGEHAH